MTAIAVVRGFEPPVDLLTSSVVKAAENRFFPGCGFRQISLVIK